MRYLNFAQTLPRIEVGHVLDVLAQLPECSIHCVVTSPPYWGLRDYKLPPVVWGSDAGCRHQWDQERTVRRGSPGDKSTLAGTQTAELSKEAGGQGQLCSRCSAWRGHLGNEPTPALYVTHLVECLRAVRRVLRDDGTLWLNLGDSYSGSGVNDGLVNPGMSKARQRGDLEGRRHDLGQTGLSPLNLVGIPWAVAVALRADGWYLRSDVIWHNLNSMPEPQQGWRWERCRVKVGSLRCGNNRGVGQDLAVTSPKGSVGDSPSTVWKPCPGCARCKPNGGFVLRRGAWRPTGAHEYVFLLAKTPDYFADGEAVRQVAVTDGDARHLRGDGKKHALGQSLTRAFTGSPTSGANLRDVWVFPTEALKEAHFAAFPRRLPELCIKAGTSERGCCLACGAPWARVVERPDFSQQPRRAMTKGDGTPDPRGYKKSAGQAWQKWRDANPDKQVGWRPTCACPPHEPVPCVVLDPFAGSGTTLRVAEDLGRLWLGVDLSSEYLKIMRKRTAQRTVFGAVGRSAVERAQAAIAPMSEEDLLQGWEVVKRKARPVRGRRA